MMNDRTKAARETARALGWFSLGLGLVEVLYTRRLAQAIGMSGHEATLRACGLREIATGAAILVAQRPAPFVWARVAGDALDLGLLGVRAASSERRTGDAAVAMAAVAGVTAVDIACARALDQIDAANSEPEPRYASRSGFPKPAGQMRGAALADFEAPADMRTPADLRPYETA
jgi:hypothetical protein